ncbi:MAG: sterol desaturase family protein [Bacteroidota bacterium]
MRKLYVSNKDESVRLFKSNFLELFTKVHYSVPLIIYLPVIGYFIYLTAVVKLGWLNGILLFAAGIIAWSFAEYFLHRYVFHYEPTSEWGQRIHFLMHGVHHDYPNDSMRLVMPPSVSIPLAFIFYYLFQWLFPGYMHYPFFAGFVLGYVIYDMMHYAIHHVNFNAKWWMSLKAHHLKHHFKDPEKGYGVSSKVWDVLIGSDFKKANEKKSIERKAVDTTPS